jgi:hypothetical protein
MKQTSLEKYLCLEARSARSTTEPRSHCEDGQNKEGSTILSQPREDTCITSIKLSKSLDKRGMKRERKYAMPDCLQPNRKKTCRSRFRSSETSFYNTSSSKKLVQESTSKEKDSRSLWTKSVKEWSPRWSSCTRTGCVDLDMISWNPSAKGFTQNCWFTVKRKKMNGSHKKRNLAKTCLPSSTSS